MTEPRQEMDNSTLFSAVNVLSWIVLKVKYACFKFYILRQKKKCRKNEDIENW